MKTLIRSLLVLALAAATAAPTTAQGSARLLVLNKLDATLAIIDPSSGSLIGKVPTGEGPHELVVSADGKYAFAANYGGSTAGNTISMIDVAAQKEVKRIDVSPLRRPHGLAFDGGKLYFTAEASRKIARYDPATDKIDWEFETGLNGTHMVLPTPDGKTILTSNIGSNSVSIITQEANGSWTQTAVDVGKGPEGIDVSADGKTAWSAHSQDGGVSVIDIPSKKVLHTFNVGTKRSNRIKLTADGKFALISDLDAGDLVVVDTATRKEVKRLALGKAPEGILIPRGSPVAYVAVNGDNFVAVVDLKTWAVTKKIQTGGQGPDGMAWKP